MCQALYWVMKIYKNASTFSKYVIYWGDRANSYYLANNPLLCTRRFVKYFKRLLLFNFYNNPKSYYILSFHYTDTTMQSLWEVNEITKDPQPTCGARIQI